MAANCALIRCLPLAGFLYLSSASVIADECRDAFVACVAETGNVPACSSVSRSCTLGATGKQINTREIDVKPTLFGRAGKRWVQLTVHNPNSEDVELTDHTENLTCADGTSLTAHFRFSGRILEGQEKIQSEPQIVCPGADFADSGEEHDGPGVPRLLGKQYACKPGDPKAPVYTLKSTDKGGRIEALSGPVRVVYDMSGGTAQGLFDVLCRDATGDSEQGKNRLVALRELLDDILPARSTGKASTPTVSTGPRN